MRRKDHPLMYVWIGTLLVSPLPAIAWRVGFGGDPQDTYLIRLIFALLFLGGSLLVASYRPLRGYFALLLGYHLLGAFVSPWVSQQAFWQAHFGKQSGWFQQMLGVQILRLLTPMAVIAWFALRGVERRAYFLARGQLDATVRPEPVLGITRDRWKRFGSMLALIVTAITLGFLLMGARPSAKDALGALPLLPGVLLLAALNAFNEELPYRGALLSQLLPVLSNRQAVLLTAALFGLGHFFGVPAGLPGMLMAGVLGWLLGKSMIETRGMFWAWLIHFLQDVCIFFFFAMLT